MHCCKHTHSHGVTDDPRFADDEFTQAALRERSIRAAHAHAGALMLGGIFALVGLAVFGSLRRK